MRFFRVLFSGSLMGILLIVFAAAIGYATFVENDFGAAAAKLKIYNSAWFEILLLLMVVNFSGMIFTKKLYLKSKLNVLVIHLALILIVIGAGVTRYFGSEGMMHIRDGQTTNLYVSSEHYVQTRIKEGEKLVNDQEKIILTKIKEDLFAKEFTDFDENIEIEVGDFSEKSILNLIPSENGQAYINVVAGTGHGRHEVYLKEGETRDLHDFTISFGDSSHKENLTFLREGNDLFIRIPANPETNTSNAPDSNLKNGFRPIKKMELTAFGEVTIVVREFLPQGEMLYQAVDVANGGKPIIRVKVNETETMLPIGEERLFEINDIDVYVKVGTILRNLPFDIKLNKFNLERYPGSNSPSSFESEVTVIDKANELEMPYKIYMNHILNYGGYRFFQSSYDQDELGTVLSVNHDYWGTFITYIGYFILFATLILSLFIKDSRFKRVTTLLNDVHEKRKKITATLTLVFLLTASSSIAQTTAIDADHASKFGALLVQNKDGRIEPINTISNKIIVKINKKTTYKGLSSDQVFLEILVNKEQWKNEPIIKVGDEATQKLIGIKGDHASFNDFIGEKGNYKILANVEQAHQKKPSVRSTFDKDVINIDERLNVFYMLLNGSILKMFPVENDPNNRWVLPQDHRLKLGPGEENAELFNDYIISLRTAMESNNYEEANKKVQEIGDFQRKVAGDIIPSDNVRNMEIFYNKANIFKRLFPYYLGIGSLLIAIFFIQTFKPKFEFKLLTRIFFWILFIAFIIQAIGLAMRWYISGHAPWSNGYESMIYISWATMLAGFIFMKRSTITLGVTSMIAGIALLTAHMSWLNPEITNLVPVLKSYWLTIHVATITASYGFLALGCMLAFLNLIILIFRTRNNQMRINLTLRELTLIIEMSISIGLVLLIVGNFLGAIWANESWGRYWGWDPKETWTLVTIILYSFTLHLAIIPGMRNTFSFSFMSLISFGAVLMTYFGVNYYLSGLHSYAGGDPISVPVFVYYSLGVVAVVSILAAYNEISFNRANR